MVIGSLYVELYLPGLRSLKEKRAILNRLKQRLKNNFNISVSEVSFQEMHQRAGIGISAVSLKTSDIEGLFEKIHDTINALFVVQITHMEKGIY